MLVVIMFDKNCGLVDIYRGGWRGIWQYAEGGNPNASLCAPSM
jgi:hypothetical protein